MPVQPPTWLFPEPNTPDLGCFVRRKHDLQLDEGTQNIHVELNPSVDFAPWFHQLYFRVKCGHAAFYERCLVYMRTDLSVPPPILTHQQPDFVLGGDTTPHPSDWQRYPTQSGERFYFFIGQYRDPSTDAWRSDALVAHTYDLYDNGTLSTVQFDDTGIDRDLNDFELEVALVGRPIWADLSQAIDQAEVTEQVSHHVLEQASRRRTVSANV